MARWVAKIDVSDVWHDGNLSFGQRRDAICARFRAAFRTITRVCGEDARLDLEDRVWELGEAEDVNEFDFIWDEIYDWADDNRVWINTF